jgi:hypothetical protein
MFPISMHVIERHKLTMSLKSKNILQLIFMLKFCSYRYICILKLIAGYLEKNPSWNLRLLNETISI